MCPYLGIVKGARLGGWPWLDMGNQKDLIESIPFRLPSLEEDSVSWAYTKQGDSYLQETLTSIPMYG